MTIDKSEVTYSHRMALIGAHEASRLHEWATHSPGTETSAEARAEYLMITARSHLMRVVVGLVKFNPSITHLNFEIMDPDPFERTRLNILYVSAALTVHGERADVDLDRVPEVLERVPGADDHGTAWDEWIVEGQVSVERVLASIDALKEPTEHVILVAFDVLAYSREQAHQRLLEALGRPDNNPIESWWVAEDDRTDGSDNDSAVFVPFGEQEAHNAWAGND